MGHNIDRRINYFDSYFKWWLFAGRQQTRATTHKIAVAIYGMLGRNSCAIESASMLTSFVDIQMLNMDKTPCPTSMALHCASLILVSSECPFNAYEHTACRRALRTYSKCPEYGGKLVTLVCVIGPLWGKSRDSQLHPKRPPLSESGHETMWHDYPLAPFPDSCTGKTAWEQGFTVQLRMCDIVQNTLTTQPTFLINKFLHTIYNII